MKRTILMNPGPVTTTASVKQALIVEDICHREKTFSDVLFDVRCKLLSIAGADTSYSSVLFASSGTGGVEACISSLIPPDKSIAIINNGAYGQRLVDIAKRYRIRVIELNHVFDEALRLQEIECCLIEHPEIAYVAMVHHETSTGVLNPLSVIGEICLRYQRGFIVDAMSSFAGSHLHVIHDHIDFVISSSNKCIQGMAGLAFVIGKKSRIIASKDLSRSYYFDLYQQYQCMEESGQLPFTPPVQVVYALQQALDELLAETLEKRVARYHANYHLLTEGLSKLGYSCLTPADKASKLLVTVRFPEDDGQMHSFSTLHRALLQQGITIYPAKNADERSFRLACIGDLHREDILFFLDKLEHYR